jgi:Nucleoside-diphosphate-sugar epimerases
MNQAEKTISQSRALDPASRIYVAGHRGLVGSAIVRRLQKGGYTNVITRTREALDLRDQRAVSAFMQQALPDYIFIAAAKVGGIHANNTYPADFIYQNLVIETNLIHAAYEAGVRRLLFLGSSCIYPRDCPQPIKEEYLLTGPLESTNESYAIAKIAGLKLCEAYNRQYETQYVTVMPTNLYGPNDNFDLKTSHVLPALLRKTHEAKLRGERLLTVWGTGTPRRELLHVDDLAEACVFLMENSSFLVAQPSSLGLPSVRGAVFNIGTGDDLTIRELAELICEVVGFGGELVFDRSKPDGTPRKLLDVSRMTALGWKATILLKAGIEATYQWYLKHCQTL